MKTYMGQIMAKCDCDHEECNLRGYCMTQPTPNHRPPGSSAPRLVGSADDKFKLRDLFRKPKYGEWAAEERRLLRRQLIAWLLFIAAFIALAVWMVLKTSVGV